MIALSPDVAFKELIARGLIAAQPPPHALTGGNADRREPTARRSWCVNLPDGTRARLTLARELGSLPNRHAAFAAACPDIATRQLFHTSWSAGEAMAEIFFEGSNFETAVREGLFPSPIIRAAIARIRQSLEATEQPSAEPARQQEWQAWCEELLALAVWQPAEKEILVRSLLPALYREITSAPPTTRWTNGDFLPANILLAADGQVRLIDTEFARRTHFFPEDAIRFRVLSSLAQERPDLAAELPATSGLAWHLYFWLRQLHLEIAQNSAEYLARYQTLRLGLLRLLAEQFLRLDMNGWSVPALVADHHVEDIRWAEDAGGGAVITGWCRAPAKTHLRHVVVLRPDGTSLAIVQPAARPDVQAHFNGAPDALYTGFRIELARSEPGPSVILGALVDQGTLLPLQVLSAADFPRGLDWSAYPEWARDHDPDPPAPVPAATGPGPLFSILLPVYRTPGNLLEECIQSVLRQHHHNWELCIVDDGSGSAELTGALHRHAQDEPRIRVTTRAQNGGISCATNDALNMAQGDFVVFLDHDDLLRPHALAELAAELGRVPDRDALYSDEDKITEEGQRIMPFLKPGFSPEFLRGVMYAGHVLCVRTTVARAVGGFDPAYDGVQDFEFLLRVTERTGRIGHLARILYHWRRTPSSSALHGNVKGNMDERQAAAVQAHLLRIGDSRRAVALGGHRVRLETPVAPDFELIPAERGSDPLSLLRQAAASSRAEVLIVLPREPDSTASAWLPDLAALAGLPDSGVVAPVLLDASGRVLESGRVGARPIMRGFHAESDGYNGSLRCNREVDLVAPLCFAIKRSLVPSLSVDPPTDWPGFCRLLRARGLYHRICAAARLRLPTDQADEPASPTSESEPAEFYPPHFDPAKGDYTLAVTPAPLRPRFNLEQPAVWDRLPRCVIIRGWCFAVPAGAATAIRLRADGQKIMLAGVVGLPRPDVKAALPEAPDENTGFEIRGTLPGGTRSIVIEARFADGAWHELAARTVSVKRQLVPLWLGGGDWTELMFFQMPAHMAYAARPVRPEKFPPASPDVRRPKLSIVTPSFQQARFLDETIRSVLEQDAGVDYVVQDGGSADGSKTLIERWAAKAGNQGPEPAGIAPAPVVSPRLVAWESVPDAGQADAIAKGFAKTSGAPDDIMGWINSDDFYLPGALAYVADYFARHPDVDVIYGHRIVVNEESREIARWFLPKHDPEVLRLNDFVPQETLFWRRRLWDKVGGLETSFQFAMDWDLLLRLQAAGANIVRVPYFLACFRIHSAQKTSARMHDLGRQEITRLRERTFGRPFPPQELEQNPRLLRYLRRSSFIEFLRRLGLRSP